VEEEGLLWGNPKVKVLGNCGAKLKQWYLFLEVREIPVKEAMGGGMPRGFGPSPAWFLWGYLVWVHLFKPRLQTRNS
jgi:hypothetical protein